ESDSTPGRVDHSSAGALDALEQFGAGLGLPLAFVIAGHHAGLADRVDLDTRLAGKRDRLDAARAHPECVFPYASRPEPPPFLRQPTEIGRDELKRRYEFWVRMLFSCLVDADFLDTERHFDEGRADTRGCRADIPELKMRLDRYMVGKQTHAAPGRV